MSSPDPLNEATSLVLPPSSRRVTRSQRSQRFLALSNTPRKQTFELEVGDSRSPQRLLVTVQTEGTDDQQSARRKLFQSPSVPVVTRRVPLRNSIEDIPTTPKKRGRPRKLNGTPMPSAAKRRATSPATERAPRRRRIADEASEASTQKTPAPAKTPRSAKRKAKDPPAEKPSRRRRTSKDEEDVEESQSEASVRPIAKPTRRIKASKSSVQDASTDTDVNASQASTSTTRGRRKNTDVNASKTPTVTTRSSREHAAAHNPRTATANSRRCGQGNSALGRTSQQLS
ncbi:hypothetical protein CDD82_4231 [Ophiocordyceps australis]|uniref:Uncharacterized protein n=1 Tax=Ophiocordyceps australis TaxID=1399860 RepID=A0A2C5Z4C1_9HYPO|nr:hypothetical protein CDD82_4231 [Ophiocordyceps australis]